MGFKDPQTTHTPPEVQPVLEGPNTFNLEDFGRLMHLENSLFAANFFTNFTSKTLFTPGNSAGDLFGMVK